MTQGSGYLQNQQYIEQLQIDYLQTAGIHEAAKFSAVQDSFKSRIHQEKLSMILDLERMAIVLSV